MHIGLNVNNTEREPLPQDLARALEERGFESLWLGEHTHIPVSRLSPAPAGGQMPEAYKHMRDPYVSLAYAASATKTLRLGTGIALLLQRDVFSQAKTIATLDVLSNGRLMIGAGVGWNKEEFENVSPHPWSKRFAALRETVAATRALWTDEEAEHHGDYVNFDKVWSFPKPAQAGGPRIHLGAMGPLGVQHAAAWADGWMPVDVGLRDAGKAIGDFRESVKRNGRSADSVEISIVAMRAPSADRLKRYRDLGVDRVIIVAIDYWDRPEALMPLVDTIAQTIPAVR